MQPRPLSLVCLLLACLATQAEAFRVERVAPQGLQDRVNTITLRFSEDMVALGSNAGGAADILSLTCNKTAVPLAGRWVSARDWRADLGAPLAASSQCEMQLKSSLRPLNSASGVASAVLTGPDRFRFSTSAPIIVESWPDAGSQIDENQIFVLQTNAPAASDPAEVLRTAGAFCASSKFGERIALQMVAATERAAVLAALKQQLQQVKDPSALILARCARPLGEDAKVSLVWGKSGRGFRTYPAFRVSVSCEREQANRPCIPVRPILLEFTAPLAASVAARITLESDKGSPRQSELAKALAKEKPGSPKSRSAQAEEVTSLEFAPVFEQSTEYTAKIPADLLDLQGRKLNLAAPLKLRTGEAPALARFAASFGIVERRVGALPVTVRNLSAVTGQPPIALKLRAQHSTDDATMIEWMRMSDYDQRNEYTTRAYPVLARTAGLSAVDMPTLSAPAVGRDTQVVGIPLQKPGLHRVEIESQALGAILPAKPGAADRPMYVRAYALVTGMAVHLKTSQENALVWVTSLETGKPVADAALSIADCNGKVLWQGKSDAMGLAQVSGPLSKPDCSVGAARVKAAFGIVPLDNKPGSKAEASEEESQGESIDERSWLVAFARKADDMSFVLSRWNEGIEPWRFNLPTGSFSGPEAAVVGHTVFPRNLLRQGEVVYMKHLFRKGTAAGLKRPDDTLRRQFDRVQITHLGSDQQFEAPLLWGDGATATSEWTVPKSAKLGIYTVQARVKKADAKGDKGDRSDRGEQSDTADASIDLGQFQVAEFRLPTMRGVVTIQADAKPAAQAGVQMSYINGGAAAGQATTVSAMTSRHSPGFSGYDEFDFSAAADALGLSREQDGSVALPERLKALTAIPAPGLVLDKKALVLDEKGSGKVEFALPRAAEPRRVRVEVNYPDPNGEVQTIGNSSTVWPAQVVIGFRQDSWFLGSLKSQQMLALSTTGKPLAGVQIEVHGFQKLETSVRKRVVGGFYSYDNSLEYKDLGKVCSGTTEVTGLFKCVLSDDAVTGLTGNLLLLASAKDKDGNVAQTGKSLWLYGSKEDWSAQDNGDRFDLLPEKRSYAPGETARFQVRLPFEKATALVAVEREGIISTFVTEIERSKPVIEVPILAQHAPNVMVSVLAIRPRLEPLGWGSFFRWGWRSPFSWWQARKESRRPPTAMVDLAKPGFRFGIAEVQVPATPSAKVVVSASPARLQPGETVTAQIQVSADKPLPAGSKVAVAVVDEALLELKENESWDLLAGLWRRRDYKVETSTAQMQVIGKRHFGLKAQAPGGGGGRSPTRELLETLAYWNPSLALDANGKATLQFKVNDSLTRFRIMVFADAGDDLLGVGQSAVEVGKDLQLISGLAPVVRDGDQMIASAVLRNTTNRPMALKFTAALNGQTLSEQSINLAAQSSQTLSWPFTAPSGAVLARALGEELKWTLRAAEAGSPAAGAAPAGDELTVRQALIPSVRSAVVAAQLTRLDGELSVPVRNPEQALPGRTRIQVDLSASLVGSLGSVRRYFEQYPFACLEQRSSKAVGLRDPKLWQIISESLPTYLDSDGLAAYFPASGTADSNRGSDVLTAYVLSVAHAAQWSVPDTSRDRMLKGLSAFVQGKLKRELYAPGKINVNAPRLLSAMEALARYGMLNHAQLAVIDPQPETWPSSAVIDWASVLSRTPFPANALRQREQWLDQAWGVLRNRMKLSGTELSFDDERRDDWWWMMASADTNAARLLHLILDTSSTARSNGVPTRPALTEWMQDLPRMANGLVKRQRNGIWPTTTANLWASLALESYAKAFERDPVAGVTTMTVGSDSSSAEWSKPTPVLQWAWSSTGSEASVKLLHKGSGKPYASIAVEAAVPLTQAVSAGYVLSKKVTPVSQAQAGKILPGDVFRVDLEIQASQAMTWVAVFDPVPAGASVLSGGAGALRGSEIEQAKSAAVAPTSGASRWDRSWPAYEEMRFDSYRAFYEYMPAGKTVVSYTLRVSQVGTLRLPSTRVEAMYAPSVYGELPNANWTVLAR